MVGGREYEIMRKSIVINVEDIKLDGVIAKKFYGKSSF